MGTVSSSRILWQWQGKMRTLLAVMWRTWTFPTPNPRSAHASPSLTLLYHFLTIATLVRCECIVIILNSLPLRTTAPLALMLRAAMGSLQDMFFTSVLLSCQDHGTVNTARILGALNSCMLSRDQNQEEDSRQRGQPLQQSSRRPGGSCRCS